jgi:hypothetical protein
VFGMHTQLFNVLFCSGLPGVVLVITIAQLTPALLAKEHPLRFLNLPGIYCVIQVALHLEKSGIMHFSYVLYDIFNSMFFKKEVEDVVKSPSCDDFVAPCTTDLEAPKLKLKTVESTDDLGSVGLDTNSERSSECVSSVTLTSLVEGNKELSVEKCHEWGMTGGSAETPDADIVINPIKTRSLFVTPLFQAAAPTLCNTVLLFIKYICSTSMIVMCLVFVVYYMAMGHSLINLALPLQLLLFFLAMVLITYCEGMKVSIVSTSHLDSEDLKDSHPIAYQVHKLLNYGEIIID